MFFLIKLSFSNNYLINPFQTIQEQTIQQYFNTIKQQHHYILNFHTIMAHYIVNATS